MPKKKAAEEGCDTYKPIKTPHATWTPAAMKEAKRVILKVTKEVSSLCVVCQAAQVPVSTFYMWLGNDPKFEAAYRKCQEMTVERLEREAYRRATEGNVKLTFDKEGNITSEEIRHSDTLLLAALKTKAPEWREAVVNKVVLGGPSDKEHNITLNMRGDLKDTGDGEG